MTDDASNLTRLMVMIDMPTSTCCCRISAQATLLSLTIPDLIVLSDSESFLMQVPHSILLAKTLYAVTLQPIGSGPILPKLIQGKRPPTGGASLLGSGSIKTGRHALTFSKKPWTSSMVWTSGASGRLATIFLP